ncbi:MAG: DUF6088 family protein [Prevotellaceae bacterium]|jgi:hypothetical protein|nr:DUF6088 family protein [Prevotellaceae bacterium]
MKRKIFYDKVKNTIQGSPRGSVYVASDFANVAGNRTINRALSRLEGEGLIRRVMRGIYEYPEFNAFLHEYVAPSPDSVARAIARNYGWVIVPYGDTALNMLGMSSQVPAVWIYICDGAYRAYSFPNTRLEFKRTTNRDISKVTYKTALVIQALKAIGRGNIDTVTTNKISRLLTKNEKDIMLKEAQHATSWIYEVIKRICK